MSSSGCSPSPSSPLVHPWPTPRRPRRTRTSSSTQIYANEFREILEDRLGPIPGDVVVTEVDFPVGDETEGIARFADGEYYECGIPASTADAGAGDDRAHGVPVLHRCDRRDGQLQLAAAASVDLRWRSGVGGGQRDEPGRRPSVVGQLPPVARDTALRPELRRHRVLRPPLRNGCRHVRGDAADVDRRRRRRRPSRCPGRPAKRS